MSIDSSDVYIGLKPSSQWTSARSRKRLVEKISEALEKHAPRALIMFSDPNRGGSVAVSEEPEEVRR